MLANHSVIIEDSKNLAQVLLMRLAGLVVGQFPGALQKNDIIPKRVGTVPYRL